MSTSIRQPRIVHLGALLLLIAVALAPPAIATDFRGGEKLTVAADEIVDGDLYASGETITIDGTVRGDLVAAARVIRVNGTVEGDLIAAAQAVVVSGTVIDDVRMGGQALQIGGEVGGHVVALGASLETLSAARIGEDLVFRGAQALLAGAIGGNLSSSSAGLELRGRIDGDAEITVGADSTPPSSIFWPPPIDVPSVPGGLLVSEQASVGGRLHYRAPAEANVSQEALIGSLDAEVTTPEAEEEPPLRTRLVAGARRFAALFVLGALLLWLVPSWTGAQAAHLRTRPWTSLGWGVVGVAGTATASLLLLALGIAVAVTLAAIQLGDLSLPALIVGGLGALLLDGALVLALAWLAQVIVGLGVGSLILRRTAVAGRQAFAALALGLLLYILVRLLPVVGWIVARLIALFGFGAIVAGLVHTLRTRRSPDKEEEAA